MDRDHPRQDRAGHIDNSVVFWIVAILAVIAGASLYREVTGQSPLVLWHDLPSDVRSFSIRAPLLLVGALILAVVREAARGDDVRSRREDDRVYILLGGPGARAFGLGLVALAVYMGWAGVAGQGLFWWIVLGLALVVGFAGASVAGTGNRIVVEPDKVSLETTFFGAGMGGDGYEISSLSDAHVSVDEHRSGGAFGQPLRFQYAVSVDSVAVHSETSRIRAEAIRDALVEAISHLGASTAPGDAGEAPDPSS